MQDPGFGESSVLPPFPAAAPPLQPPQFPEQEQLRCPRCDSSNTKFCYYNNYNLSQPRHYCKACRRYWTKGGALRNIPVGGGSRKNAKRSSPAAAATSAAAKRAVSGPGPADSGPTGPGPKPEVGGPAGLEGQVGSFTSLLAAAAATTNSTANHGQFGSVMDGFGPGLGGGQGGEAVAAEGFMGGLQGNGSEGGCWGGGGGGGGNNGWPDLAIYTPASRFQ